MAGKLTTVLSKKEAEAYSSQGLHSEALKVYKDLLSSTPNLGDTFKGMVHTQMASIEQELDDGHPQEEVQLSASEIKCIKEGWGDNAPEGDVIVCAKAFCRVGHHLDALPDVVKLLKNGCATEKVVEIFADCMVHLNKPNQLLNSVTAITDKIYSRPQDRLRLCVLTTEAIVGLNQPLHAYALYRYLKQHPVVSKQAPQRLIVIAKGIKQLQEDRKKEAEKKEAENMDAEESASEANAPPPDAAEDQPSSGWFAAIKKRFKK